MVIGQEQQRLCLVGVCSRLGVHKVAASHSTSATTTATTSRVVLQEVVELCGERRSHGGGVQQGGGLQVFVVETSGSGTLALRSVQQTQFRNIHNQTKWGNHTHLHNLASSLVEIPSESPQETALSKV